MDYYSTKDIRQYLIQLGFRPSIKGFNYIASSIELCMKDQNYLHSITKSLYPDVARIHSTKATRVERAIRHAITLASDNPNSMFKETFEPYENCSLSNSLTLGILLEHFI